MTSRTAMKANEVIKTRSGVPAGAQNGGIRAVIEKMKPQIEAALTGTALEPERFTRLVLSALSENPKLASCSQNSFLAAMMQAAQLGLEPNTPLGQAYLIPYGNQCQFVLGYRGLVELAHRSKEITRIDAQVVYENDEFEYELGWDQKLIHRPAASNRGKPVYYYGLYKTRDGGGSFQVMSREDAVAHGKKFSRSYNNGPWKTDFDSMALKTVLKQALKYAPLSVEVQKAVASDEQIKEPAAQRFEEGDILDVSPEYDVMEEETAFPEPESGDDEVKEIQEQLKQEKVFD